MKIVKRKLGLAAEKAQRSGRFSFRMTIGLRGKIVILCLVSILAIIGAMVVLSVRSLTDAFNSEYQDKGVAIVRTFDALYEGSLGELGDTELTQRHIDNLMALNTNIYKISLYNRVGDKVVRTASSDKTQIGDEADADDAEPISTGRIIFNDKRNEGQSLVEILAPLHAHGQPVAAIGVYLRLAPRDEAIQNQTVRLVIIGTSAGIILVLILYLFMSRILLEPLMSLRRSTQAVGNGSLSTRIVLRRKDELGALAADFNGMADSLQKRADENQQLQEQLQEKYQLAQTQAITDAITGLYNHRCFQDSLTKELERGRRYNTPVTLLFLDIDHFKTLNDNHGHQFGDYVLRELASLLKSAVRDIDIVARYGGEEFAVVLPSTDREGGYLAAERIRRAVADHDFGGDLNSRRITVSVGVASYPEDGITREELTPKADRAMYQAKQLGRNQVRLYGELRDESSGGAATDDATLTGEPYLNLVRSLARAVDARDHYTNSHSESVAGYATAIAQRMGMNGRQLENIDVAGKLHDIGKIGLPDSILSKAEPLTETEWEKIREHPEIGEAIVKQVLSLEMVVPVIAAHHERYDGKGYPRGIKGEEIPLGARILAVADAYQAMTSDRPYRSARAPQEAIAELRRQSGTQFDPQVVEVFVETLSHSLNSSRV